MIKKSLKYIFIMIFASMMVTVGIDATDHYDNMSESFLGKIFFPSDGPCSSDMVFVPFENGGFCIDRYEASSNKKCPVLAPSSQKDTRVNLTSAGCFPVSAEEKIPWTFISQSQAREACARAGKRLPSNEEWFAASLGTPDLKIKNWDRVDCQLASNWKLQPGETGTGENCVSAYGSYDMVGNVWEWVVGEVVDGKYQGKDLADSGFIDEVDSSGLASLSNKNKANPNFNNDYMWLKKTKTRGIARGGFWDNKKEGGIYATYLVSQPSFAGIGVGFRCVK